MSEMVTETGPQHRVNVAVLGDSRAFDTYYTNPRYKERYGYDRSFPFVLRQIVTADREAPFEIVHIPDHFRSGTVENNIIRLALLDPAIVILLDGIWETLIGKEQFIEYATRKIRSHDFRSADKLPLEVSGRKLVELYLAGELSVSPSGYVEKQRQLVSYFRRRRRECVWLTIPAPDSSHFDRLHFAGDYRCLPDWDRCINAINDAVAPMVRAYGGRIVDLNRLMAEHGGADRSLIDQWHFTQSFHTAIARHLAALLKGMHPPTSKARASSRHMIAGPLAQETVLLHGTGDMATAWMAENPSAKVEAVIAPPGSAPIPGVPVLGERDISGGSSSVVLLLEESRTRQGTEPHLLEALGEHQILLYPEELMPLANPPGGRRAEQGQHPLHGTE